ncbi:hypothetical protein BVX98_04295 [bacterium F11]|nr:hypothetical protein BVX98_04295 [bacterium F11]
MSQCDVLNLEWCAEGRDRDSASLISFALRKKGYVVEEESLLDWRYAIYKHRPKVIFNNNPIGGIEAVWIIRQLAKWGIPVVSFIAEGNFIPVISESFLWGHNIYKVIYHKYHCLWSERTRGMALDVDPRWKDKLLVSGAVRFDSYSIFRFLTRGEFLKKYNKENYKKVIGFAGFCFDFLDRPEPRRVATEINGEEKMKEFEKDRTKLNQMLKKMVMDNPSILFVMKEHPGTVLRDKSELSGLGQYPNVVSIQNEEQIGDCINVCDIWTAYESTTCIEAWNLGKPTFMISPYASKILRSNVKTGSPIFESNESIQNAINLFYEKGAVPGFDERKERRREVVRETIEWDDGKNHMRAAYIVEKALEGNMKKRRVKLSFFDAIRAFVQTFIFNFSPYFYFLPKFRSRVRLKKIFNKLVLNEVHEKYRPFLEEFHKNHPFTEEDKRELDEINGFSKSVESQEKEREKCHE